MKKRRIYLTPEWHFDLIPYWWNYHKYTKNYVENVVNMQEWNFAIKWLFIRLNIEIKIR